MVVCLGITGGFSRYVCDVNHALANFCRKLCRLELCFAAMASIASVEAWRRIQRGWARQEAPGRGRSANVWTSTSRCQPWKHGWPFRGHPYMSYMWLATMRRWMQYENFVKLNVRVALQMAVFGSGQKPFWNSLPPAADYWKIKHPILVPLWMVASSLKQAAFGVPKTSLEIIRMGLSEKGVPLSATGDHRIPS